MSKDDWVVPGTTPNTTARTIVVRNVNGDVSGALVRRTGAEPWNIDLDAIALMRVVPTHAPIDEDDDESAIADVRHLAVALAWYKRSSTVYERCALFVPGLDDFEEYVPNGGRPRHAFVGENAMDVI